MENLQSLEDTTDDLKKQMWNLIKNVIPKLEEKIENSSGPSSLEKKISELESHLSLLENATISQIESEIAQITGTIIPELKEKVENSQGSASGDDWTTVYDKTSNDESINWGYKNGLVSSIGLISTSIDFTPYKFIRIYYTKGTYSIYHDFNIEEVRDATSYIPYFVITLFDSTIVTLTGQAFGLKYDATTGARQFYVGRGRSWNLKANAYITYNDLSTDTYCFISRIQVKN